MYKLLIADDDSLVSSSIMSAVPWEKCGIGEVMTADDGEAAERIFTSFLPDIVLTDIRMPGLDGLELLERIKKVKSDTKVIIFSGFNDFAYAQTAIKMGAFEYLLKISDMDELVGVVCRAVEEIKNECRERELNQKIRQQLKQSLPLLKHRYLNELIQGFSNLEDMMRYLEFVDIKLESECFMTGVAEFDNYLLSKSHMTEEELLFLKLKVLNLAEELLGEQGVCFESKSGEFVLLFYCSSEAEGEDKVKYYIKCEELIDIIYKRLNRGISLGLSNMGKGMASICTCYQEAKKALEHKLFTTTGSIIRIEDIAYFTNVGFRVGSDKQRKLEALLGVGDKKQVMESIKDVFDRIEQQRFSDIGRFHGVCIELLSIASRVLSEFDVDMEQVLGVEFLYFEEVKKYKTFHEAKEWMLTSFDKVTDYILNTKIIKTKKIIETAKKYIDDHYNEEITRDKVAEIIHMSPNYFSSLFSTEVGQSFQDYITMRRIEKAKLLLGEKDSRAFEVGENVGYDNPYYFSRIFKKYTGMSPMEYRESLK